jgi:hypothetical protein
MQYAHPWACAKGAPNEPQTRARAAVMTFIVFIFGKMKLLMDVVLVPNYQAWWAMTICDLGVVDCVEKMLMFVWILGVCSYARSSKACCTASSQ